MYAKRVAIANLAVDGVKLDDLALDFTVPGYDLDLIALVRRNVRIPVVASSGAGKAEHFVEVFQKTGVEAALAAGIFHRNEVGIDEVKAALTVAGINVRTV